MYLYFVCITLGICSMVVGGLTQETTTHTIEVVSFTLNGGPKEHEGLLEISTKTEHFNLCADEDNLYSSITNTACTRLGYVYSGIVYDDNVFGASSTTMAISKPHELSDTEKYTFQGELVQNCTKLISLCCSSDKNPKPTKFCSANWTVSMSRLYHYHYCIPSIDQIRIFAGSSQVNTDTQLSWIQYGFKVDHESCQKDTILTNDYKTILKTCADMCLIDILDNKRTLGGADVDQICNCEGHVTSQCPNITLQLTRHKDDNMVLCVAGSIKDRIPKLVAHDCSKYLPTMYLLSECIVPTTTTPSTSVTYTTTVLSTTDTETHDEEDDSGDSNAVPGSCSLINGLCILVSYVLCSLFIVRLGPNL